MQLRSEVAAGDPVVEIAFDLGHSQSGVDDIDGHGCLDAPAGGEGQGGVEGLPCQAAHARQRLGRLEAAELGDALLRQPDDEAEPSAPALLRGQDRDRHIGLPGQDRIGQRRSADRGVLEVAVDEQQRSMVRIGTEIGIGDLPVAQSEGPGHHGRCLALVLRVGDDLGPGPPGQGARVIARSVVDDHDDVDPGDPLGRGHGRADALGLVHRGDDGGDRLGGGVRMCTHAFSCPTRTPARAGPRCAP